MGQDIGKIEPGEASSGESQAGQQSKEPDTGEQKPSPEKDSSSDTAGERSAVQDKQEKKPPQETPAPEPQASPPKQESQANKLPPRNVDTSKQQDHSQDTKQSTFGSREERRVGPRHAKSAIRK